MKETSFRVAIGIDIIVYIRIDIRVTIGIDIRVDIRIDIRVAIGIDIKNLKRVMVRDGICGESAGCSRFKLILCGFLPNISPHAKFYLNPTKKHGS